MLTAARTFFFKATTVKGTGRCEQVKKKNSESKKKKVIVYAY